MADEYFDVPVEPAETAPEVEGEEPEVEQDDDEGVSDPAGEPEVEQDPDVEARAPAAPERNRTQERIRALNAAKKAAEEKAERIQQEYIAALRERHAPPPPVVDPRVEQERIALMSDREYFEYTRQKDRAELEARFQKQEMANQINADKAAFANLVASDPRVKPYAGKVEERFNALLKAGTPQTRESILKYVIGETVLSKGGKALAAARETGRANIDRQTTRPASARSNVSPGEGRSADREYEAAAKRLEQHLAQVGRM